MSVVPGGELGRATNPVGDRRRPDDSQTPLRNSGRVTKEGEPRGRALAAPRLSDAEQMDAGRVEETAGRPRFPLSVLGRLPRA